MQRRSLLKLGAASAALLAVAGGTVALLGPGLRGGRMTDPSRTLMTALAAALLDGSLPPGGAARAAALDGLLARVDGLVAGLPDHAQDELSQLLALLATTPGRTLLAGVDSPWPQASLTSIRAGLQSMRLSSLGLRQQAYHALHDIVGAAFFSDPATWKAIGYPGPIAT
jgi:hypothetical protein